MTINEFSSVQGRRRWRRPRRRTNERECARVSMSRQGGAPAMTLRVAVAEAPFASDDVGCCMAAVVAATGGERACCLVTRGVSASLVALHGAPASVVAFLRATAPPPDIGGGRFLRWAMAAVCCVGSVSWRAAMAAERVRVWARACPPCRVGMHACGERERECVCVSVSACECV